MERLTNARHCKTPGAEKEGRRVEVGFNFTNGVDVYASASGEGVSRGE
jgi:hypothetical protein